MHASLSHPVVDVIQHQDSAPLGGFGPSLASTLEVRVWRPYLDGRVPQELGDALIVLGGEMNAYADDAAPWLPTTRELMRRAVAAETPLLGICLGAQLLAVACGGRVEVGDARGEEVGAVEVEVLESDPLVAGLDRFTQYAQHGDAVAELPPGARTVASGAVYDQQVFRVGGHAWGTQFHPEATLDILRKWCVDAYGEGEFARDVLGRAAEVEAPVTEASRVIAGNFSRIVLDASRAR